MKIAKLYYPWLSVFLGLLLIGWLLISHQNELVQYYDIPPAWLYVEINIGLTALYFLILFLETGRFVRSKKMLQDQISKLWSSKKQLQTKAHTYSGHAEKLKLFISDKLLEYIEYDEKFLHFKSIASEVRHNGVISYDKVKTALQLAIKAEESADQSASDKMLVSYRTQYQDALDSMRYLWDLLDLSTTDNIALHISNHLCECEEHYYQKKLNNGLGVPYQPDFSPRKAVLRTLNSLLHADADLKQDELFDDLIVDVSGRVYANLQPTAVLLGNPNYLILLLENLLKNAQFFAGKRQGANKYAPIRMTLEEQKGLVNLSVYNTGPHIDEENREKIFQLGFSSRRVKEYHGKGLGLFFVKQIISGYEGKITFKNISNQVNSYELTVTLENGDVVHEKIVVSVNEKDKPLCETPDNPVPKKSISWQFKHKIVSVEIGLASKTITDKFSDFQEKGVSTYLEPFPDSVPSWALDVNLKRGSNNLVFSPIDITGVLFQVSLPTAETFMDGGSVDDSPDIDDEVERLDMPFQQVKL